MRNPRVTPLLVAALAGAGAWWAGSHRANDASPTGANAVSVTARQGAAAIAGARAESRRIVEFLETPAHFSAAPATLAELTPDAAALTAEIAELQMLAADSGLELQTRQWAALATATLKIQAIRQAFEATIATAAPLAEGRFRVEIPAYAAAGDALRARFQAELREQLGEANAAEVLQQIGARLEGRFAGFGVSVQTLDIVVDRSGGGGDVVTRTVNYWNGVAGGERLTTRRETHFPDREDPTGELWRPLLALVGSRS